MFSFQSIPVENHRYLLDPREPRYIPNYVCLQVCIPCVEEAIVHIALAAQGKVSFDPPTLGSLIFGSGAAAPTAPEDKDGPA
jgi:hypothetical protein